MRDDDVLLCRVCDVVLSSHIHCIGDEGFYAKRRGLLCQSDDGLLCRMSLILDKATGTTCITQSCLMESVIFIFESFGVEFYLMAYDELRCYMILCFVMTVVLNIK